MTFFPTDRNFRIESIAAGINLSLKQETLFVSLRNLLKNEKMKYNWYDALNKAYKALAILLLQFSLTKHSSRNKLK